MKTLMTGFILITSFSLFAKTNTVYDCTPERPELVDMMVSLNYLANGTITTTMTGDDQTYVQDGPCSLLASGDRKNNLICTDDDGESVNLILDTTNMTLKMLAPWDAYLNFTCTNS